MNATDKTYLRRLGLALAAYLVLLALSVRFVLMYAYSPWRFVVAISPVLPALYAIVAFAQFLGDMDELQRRIHLEGMAFAFAGTAIGTFGYGFLEKAGLPHLSWHYIWPGMTVLWAIGVWLANRRYQ